MAPIRAFYITVFAFFTLACGGGGSSSAGPAANPATGSTAPPAVGGFTLLVGDSPLDGVERVDITIEEIILLGTSGQEVVSSETIGPINLLELRNITELLFEGDVPAGEYTKVRLQLSQILITETDGSTESAQLPGNGKLDLNPQGSFDITSGEDLVVQIDFDLERSIHLKQTGNGKYKLRPVVFIDVIDQAGARRLTRLFGEISADVEGSPTSDFDLCTTTLEGDLECADVDLSSTARVLASDGTSLADTTTLTGETAHIFGHFRVDPEGQRLFTALIVAAGTRDSLHHVQGSVAADAADPAAAFDLRTDEEAAGITTVLTGDALLLDGQGELLESAITEGQRAEAWAQDAVVQTAEAGTFPAFVVQISEADASTSVAGTLFAIEGDQITLLADGEEICVITQSDTEFLLVAEDGEAAESQMLDFGELIDLINTQPPAEAFGTEIDGCLLASTVIIGTAD